MEFGNGSTECLGRRQLREKMNSHKSSREKTEKDLKTAPIFAKHAFFTTKESRQQVASSSRQNTQRQKFEKIF